ncbi:hypothetical protein QTP70_010547 [Hemibagrus guttatus]|uniref:Reverse transcriptase domain-containing protein n=1 Tax=Hemibagrus guttatus TaxID=175788 RepID=A0AAE0R4B2_9TELE|nr:hypothetical protein QTP70_010547 [Hemibagrus guttatus]
MAVVVNPGLDRSAHQHWIPQVCVLSPLLFSLYTNGCTSGHQSVKLLKFADDTTLIGLISDGDESAYRGEIDRLVSWCSTNNLEFNSLKTVEMAVDFRKDPAPRPPVILCDSPVSSAESFCFLGTTITKELKWEQNIRSLTKKAQQRLYFLRQLKKFLLPVKMLVNFYTAIIESVLTSSITVWFAAATARDKAKLQRVIHSAEKPFRGGLAGVFWIIVLLQNPNSLQLEVTNLPIYQPGRGYKAISKALGLPRTTVRAIIYKWRKHGTVENLLRSGWPTKITPRVQ